MVKSELHIVEVFVDRFISGTNESGKRDAQGGDFVPAFQAACGHLKQRWLHELFSGVKDHVIFRFIRYHQLGLAVLSNKLAQHESSIPGQVAAKQEAAVVLQQGLNDLIDHLRHHYRPYFDTGFKLPVYSCRKLAEKLKQESKVLSENNDERYEGLLRSTGHALDSFEKHITVSGVSYQEQEQINAILAALRAVYHPKYTRSPNELFHDLVQLNFNADEVAEWFQVRFKEKLSRKLTEQAQEDLIENELFSFRKTTYSTQPALFKGAPSLAENVASWLLTLKKDAHADTMAGVRSQQVLALPLNCSVPQFALFIRLLYLGKGIPVNNVTWLFRFCSQHFRTKKQEHISVKSFGRAFYTSDQSSAAVVRDILKKMITQLETLYFPK